MNLKKSTLAAGIGLAIGLGTAGQASAGIYAGSRLLVEGLTLSFAPTVPFSDPVAGQFDFSTTSAAGLTPGGGDASIAGCSGNVTSVITTCGAGGAGTPVLYTGTTGTIIGIGPADVNGGRPLMTAVAGAPYLGPAGGVDYASSDAIIDNSELVDAINGVVSSGTATRQISEVEIDTADLALANSDISSTTSLTYLLSIGGNGVLTADFLADVDLLAQFDDPLASDATASANTQFTVELSGPNGISVSWAPEFDTGACTDGALETNLTLAGGATCVAEIVAENLNGTVTAPGPLPTSCDDYSRAAGGAIVAGCPGPADMVFQAYQLSIGGLTPGDYAITLNGKTAANVTRTAVPEPVMLALLGSGLLMFGANARRQRKAKA